jgi:hypothetical protein
MDKEFKKIIKKYEKRLCQIVKDRGLFAIDFKIDNPSAYEKIRVEAGSWIFKAQAGFQDDYYDVAQFHKFSTDTLNWVCSHLDEIEHELRIAMDVYEKEEAIRKEKRDKCRNTCIKNITEYLGD